LAAAAAGEEAEKGGVKLQANVFACGTFDCMSRSSALHIAAGNNNTAVLDEVLLLPPREQQTALVNPDGGKNTPLHIASYKGHLEFVTKILFSCTMSHYSQELSNIVNDNGDSPLHLAVLGNHLPVVRALLHASPPSNVDLKDKQGYTPMHYACGEGYLDIVQVSALQGRMPRTRSTPAHTGFLFTFQLLFAMGATFAVTNAEGLTPLMCCSQQGHAHVVRFIIEQDPQCVFFCNSGGDTALHYAGRVTCD
jgi:ankyrin repeat protein